VTLLKGKKIEESKERIGGKDMKNKAKTRIRWNRKIRKRK
jgi:hypothetical protein